MTQDSLPQAVRSEVDDAEWCEGMEGKNNLNHILIIASMVQDGGMTAHLHDLIEHLIEQGRYTLHIVTLRPWDKDFDDLQAKGVIIHNPRRDFPIKTLRVLLRHPFRFIRIIQQLLSHWQMTNWKGNARLFGELILLHEALTNHQIDLISAYHVFPEGLSGVWAKQWFAVPLAITVTGEMHMNSQRPYYLQRAKKILTKPTRLLSLSHRCASGVEHIGLRKDSVTITYYGVDCKFFAEATKADVERAHERWGGAGKRIVLYTGRLSEITGVSVLVEAMPRIISQYPDAHFILTGKESAYRRGLQKRIQELGLDKHVTFTGFLPEEELPILYAYCDLLAYPQSVPYGCWGLSLLEAMSAAKPVVASRIAGVPEVVIDGETGILVEPRNPELLANAILTLLQDEQLAKQMGKAGLERVTKRFDQKVTSYYIEHVFQDIVSKT